LVYCPPAGSRAYASGSNVARIASASPAASARWYSATTSGSRRSGSAWSTGGRCAWRRVSGQEQLHADDRIRIGDTEFRYEP